MKLFIKNMKGAACISCVRSLIDELQLGHESTVSLGVVSLPPETASEKVSELKRMLAEKKYYIVFDRKNFLTEKVKHLLYGMIEGEELPDENYSAYISRNLYLNYNYLANVFSEVEGISIEHFIIALKIGKAKILLQDSSLTIGQIAYMLRYSSIGHFSNQFKKLTGTSPTIYKKAFQNNLFL